MEIWTMVFPMTNMVLVFDSREKAYEYLTNEIPMDLCPKHSKDALASLNESYSKGKSYFSACYDDFDESIEFVYVFKNVVNPKPMTADEYFKNIEKNIDFSEKF